MASAPTTDTECGRIDCVAPPDFLDIATPVPVVYFNEAVTYDIGACPAADATWELSIPVPGAIQWSGPVLHIFTIPAGFFSSLVSQEAATAQAQSTLDTFVNDAIASGDLSCVDLCDIVLGGLAIEITGGANDALLFTAVDPTIADTITITYVNPAAANITLLVTVVGTAISIRLATNGASAVTTTAILLKAAVEASVAATALVTVSHWASTGVGVVAAVATVALIEGGGDSFECYAVGSAVGLPDRGSGFTGAWRAN